MAEAFIIPVESLHNRATHWFTRARAALLGAIPCGRGCSRCCVGTFPITVLDARVLRQGVSALSSRNREAIETRAMELVTAMESAFPRLGSSPFLDDWNDAEQDAVAAHFADMTCPALDRDGSCRVYEARPVTCRTMGIPIDEDGVVQGACEIQTAVPVVRLPHVYRQEEDSLAELEAQELETPKDDGLPAGDEIFLPYGFLPEPAWTGFSSIR